MLVLLGMHTDPSYLFSFHKGRGTIGETASYFWSQVNFMWVPGY